MSRRADATATGAVTGRRRRTRRRHVLPMLGAARLLAVRTARRDVVLLAVWSVVVALAVAVAVAGPRLAERVLDDGAREAVAEGGRQSDLVAMLPASSVSRALEYADGAVDDIALPGLRGVVAEVHLAVTGAGVQASALSRPGFDEAPRNGEEGSGVVPGHVEGTAVVAVDPFYARLALLPDEAAVRVVEGEMPADATAGDDGLVPVAVPAAFAQREDIRAGDVIELVSQRVPPSTMVLPPVSVRVTALVEPVDATSRTWADAGLLWTNVERQAVPVLARPEAARVVDAEVDGPWSTIARFVVDPERFDAATARQVRADLAALEVDVAGLLPDGVRSRAALDVPLEDVLDAYLRDARSAAAQMSVPTLGAAGTVALVLVLLSRLIVERRRAEIELERARGAAVGTVVLRLGMEAVVVTALATGAVLAALHAALPGATNPIALGAVLAAALLAGPVWGGAVARRAWSGSRVPANRRDRVRLARRRAAARVVLELGVLAVAAAAVVALRRRGLLQTTTADSDPFLGATPLLVALAAGVVALRLYPWPVVAAGGLARRSRGALGVVGASRARRALRPLPLLVLTLAVAVGVSGLLLVGTVRAGQVRASWDVVGADAVVTAGDVRPLAASLRAAPGVTEVTTAEVVAGARVDLGNRNDTVTVVIVDETYPTTARLPGAGADLDVLERLPFGQVVPQPERGDPRPVVQMVVSPDLAARVGERGIALRVHGARTDVEIVGTTEHAPRGLGPGPYVFAALGTIIDDDGPVPPSIAWVHGPGAGEAVADVAEREPDADVLVQADWLAEGRSDALVRGVERMLVLGAAVSGLLAAVGAVATALSGARERGRTLAMLRTLGMHPRTGWWLAGVELAPVVLAALVAGGAAGAAIVVTLGGSMGLDVLIGGVAPPAVTVEAAALAWVGAVGVGLLVAAVAVDALAHRRMRLAEVLRVGETPGT